MLYFPYQKCTRYKFEKDLYLNKRDEDLLPIETSAEGQTINFRNFLPATMFDKKVVSFV